MIDSKVSGHRPGVLDRSPSELLGVSVKQFALKLTFRVFLRELRLRLAGCRLRLADCDDGAECCWFLRSWTHYGVAFRWCALGSLAVVPGLAGVRTLLV